MTSQALRSRLKAFPLPIAATAILVACGGGGSNETTTADPNAVDTLPAVATSIALAPTTDCTMAGIGATKIVADANVSILEVTTGITGSTSADKPYCLVKVKVDPQINLWVAMPTGPNWNGRFRAEGGGGYGGYVDVATDSIRQGFVGVQTDTGHSLGPGTNFITNALFSGSFAMKAPGVSNTQLQQDFAFRSEHLMAVVGKQLAKAFYGQDPVRSYWYGCSTGGRQGLRMAQDYPADYDAILAGAPAIHWDRFQAQQIWPQLVMQRDLGAPLTDGKRALATQRAVAACDARDGVADGVIDDPRSCTYDPRSDTTITKASCTSSDDTCLSPAEAGAVQKIWAGARDMAGNLLWPGVQRGADLGGLGGNSPFPISVDQPKYWVYLDPAWDWKTLDYTNYANFFQKTVDVVGPLMASDNPDLSAFRKRGGKLIMYHGWADQLIMPEGTVRYYEAVKAKVGTTDFAKLFMVPGMAHCSGGAGPDQFGQQVSGVVPQTPQRDAFRALMAWSESGTEPKAIIASAVSGGATTRTRPLCPYPQVARYNGSGSSDDASNFSCVAPSQQ